MVKVGSYRRVISPSAAIMCLAGSERPRCNHGSKGNVGLSFPDLHRVWSLSEIIGTWDKDNFGLENNDQAGWRFGDETTNTWTYWSYSTTVCDSYPKLNIMLALSARGCVIKDERCCIACAAELLGMQLRNSRAPRVICFTSPNLTLARRSK